MMDYPYMWSKINNNLNVSSILATLFNFRLDYCRSRYIGFPATRLNCLNRVLLSVACLIGRVSKFDHISAYMRDVLHWLPLRQRIEFRVAVLIWYSLIGQAPAYLTDLCRPSLSARRTCHLRSAEQGLFRVPFARTSTMQSRALAVPLVRNGLPLALRSLPRVFSEKFLQQLKTTLLVVVGSASE